MFAIADNPHIYNPADIDQVLSLYGTDAKIVSWKNKKYYNIPCAFDIETTSFYIDENGYPIDYATKQSRKAVDKNYNPEKRNIMYVWQFGINGAVIVGRTWDEFITMLKKIQEFFCTPSKANLIIWVHNLGYEFQFMRKWLEWEKVFAVEKYKPVYALTTMGIEFRCSQILSGYSLKKVGDELQKYHVQKLVGDLDYSLLRHTKTPLTEKELGYCVNDVLVVMAYIQEQIEQYHNNIARLPLTNTGRVREFCRDICFYESDKPRRKSRKKQKYKEFINGLTMNVDEYEQLKRAFQGGFTHANANFVPWGNNDKTVENVASFDYTSSYPAVMVAEEYPMGQGELIDLSTIAVFSDKDKAEFMEKQMRLYCCVMDVRITNLEPIIYQEHYLSEYRCSNIMGGTFDNGRIVSAKQLETTITEQDFFIMKRVYRWDKIEFKNFRRYQKGYLPKDFVKAILMLYKDKTTLKGVKGKEVEYLRSKGMLNSCYGMAVTDPCRDDVIYNDDKWGEEKPNLEKAIDKYNNSQSRFLFYAWGVWVTAYARRNLWSGILACGEDYIYSDTDSLKIRNWEKHKEYFNAYNKAIEQKLINACKHHGFKLSVIAPSTNKGIKKMLGVWDFEGVYKRFKTLGAKRYLVEDEDEELHLTVAGLNKTTTIPWLLDQCNNDNTKVFKMFSNKLHVPGPYTGKNIHTYIDDVQDGELTDYTGITAHYHELSSVHLESADYDLGLAQEFVDYLKGLEDL